jgi:tricarballylate dehydrogenase
LIPLGIVVNKFAKRFYDEGEDLWTKRYVLWGHLARDQPDQIVYVIIDSKMMGETLVPMYPGIKADTIKELAKKVNLDSEALSSTVEEFNLHVTEDTKYDLSKLDGKRTNGLNPDKTNWARKLDKPPFYLWPMVPGITFTFQSVRIDTETRVLDQNNRPIDNVYAAGELTSGNIYGRGYVGGTGLVIGTVTGITAGKEAVKND